MGAALRSDIEDFLFLEADLLDSWQLEQWSALFTDDAEYLIPPTDEPDGDPHLTQFLVYDDKHRLVERARRLMNKAAHAEFPHSRTRRIISNVRIVAQQGDDVTATCNFFIHRAKGPITDVYPGRASYRLRREPGGWKIASKRAALDLATLRPQGKVSIIL